MLGNIPEADWKIFRKLREVALERYCERVLAEVTSAATRPGASYHARYLDVFAVIAERDRELADTFNVLSRSTAFLKLMVIRSLGLLTDEELAGFSEETRERMRLLIRRLI